ncbi:hypothetical protein D9M73_62670 [compost metagenome]
MSSIVTVSETWSNIFSSSVVLTKLLMRLLALKPSPLGACIQTCSTLAKVLAQASNDSKPSSFICAGIRYRIM